MVTGEFIDVRGGSADKETISDQRTNRAGRAEGAAARSISLLPEWLFDTKHD